MTDDYYDDYDDYSGRHRRDVRVDATSQVPVLADDYVAPRAPSREKVEREGVLKNSAVMAAGTTFSRLSGFLRSSLLVAALGASVHADIFNIANTVPNMLYILLAGGVFNAVLVPQLVRAMESDPDGGQAYTQRVMTLAALFLGVVSVLMVVAAPWVMSLFLNSDWSEPARAADRDAAITMARYCLPQIFFYGMFVLVGQVLNARGRFGPMMWAPIANNAISVAVLVIYLVAFGPITEGVPFTPAQEQLLGIGATVGIAAQLVILVPYLRAAGVRLRPRFDFRNSGLGHTLRLGVWTVLFVIVNQIAYTVVVRLAAGGTAAGGTGAEASMGYTVYSQSFLIVMVPHSIITVSLATSILPRLSSYAADEALPELGRLLSSTLRTALAVIVPFVALLPLVAPLVADVVWGWGAGADQSDSFVPSLSLFGAGLLFFTLHYLALRGFFALEETRTVFFIQCVVSSVNIVAALILVRLADAQWTAPALVIAYSLSYAAGAGVSLVVLHRRLGRSGPWGSWGLLSFAIKLGLVTLAALVIAEFAALAVYEVIGEEHGKAGSLAGGLVITAVMGLSFLLAAWALRLSEVTSVVEMISKRLRLPRRT